MINDFKYYYWPFFVLAVFQQFSRHFHLIDCIGKFVLSEHNFTNNVIFHWILSHLGIILLFIQLCTGNAWLMTCVGLFFVWWLYIICSLHTGPVWKRGQLYFGRRNRKIVKCWFHIKIITTVRVFVLVNAWTKVIIFCKSCPLNWQLEDNNNNNYKGAMKEIWYLTTTMTKIVCHRWLTFLLITQ